MSFPDSNTIPQRLPFDAQSFGFEHFERFCLAYFTTQIALPNFSHGRSSPDLPGRLRVIDAMRYGHSGEKQLGIDLLVTMENREHWIVQCKHSPRLAAGEVAAAMKKAEEEYGPQNPAHYLLWVSGTVSPAAIEVAKASPHWTLWDGERLTTELLNPDNLSQHQASRIIGQIFGEAVVKIFFPLPDSLLINQAQFFAKWLGLDRPFHHEAEYIGQKECLEALEEFGQGGPDNRVLILVAAGGIGKTRLLREAARRLEAAHPAREIRFTNPDAPANAEAPRYANFGQLTVLHDDAHRIETLHKLLLACLATAKPSGSRLVLAARPGSEDVLRGRLMAAGYSARDIQTVRLRPLDRQDLKQLASNCLGEDHSHLADQLVAQSRGCALITTVGARLLVNGDLSNFDLVCDEDFCAEVFTRFEGEELQRINGTADLPMKDLLRAIALLSPWNRSNAKEFERLATFLELSGRALDGALDQLQVSGLLQSTSNGVRLTPDLFSDHLVYSAAYDSDGQPTKFVKSFINAFLESEFATISKNLAEADWRARLQHGEQTRSVIDPIWRHFLAKFEEASFWERSELISKWTHFAAYQPARTVELAERAIELKSPGDGLEPSIPFTRAHASVIECLPALLKPIAIWSDSSRQRALDLLWQIHRDFPDAVTSRRGEKFTVFGEISNLGENPPAAPQGVLDWLKGLANSEDAAFVFDHPAPLLDTSLRPIFARMIQETRMSSPNTLSIQTVAIRFEATKDLREQAIAFLVDEISPRGTVAAINALPPLIEGFHPTASLKELPHNLANKWQPEREKVLAKIRAIAERHPHPVVHFEIRRQLHWPVIYGSEDDCRTACLDLIASLPDTFELRLARLTLGNSHDDLLTPFDSEDTEAWYEEVKHEWNSLENSVLDELLSRNRTGESLHDALEAWAQECTRHGLIPHLGGILANIANRDSALGLAILDTVLTCPTSNLAGYVGILIPPRPADLEAVKRCLDSRNPDVIRSVVNSIRYQPDLQSEEILLLVSRLIPALESEQLPMLFGLAESLRDADQTDALVASLIDRQLSPTEVKSMADAVYRRIRHERAETHSKTMTRVLDAFMRLPKLPGLHRRDPSFLREMIKRDPHAVFDRLLCRIERQQSKSSQEGSANDFEFYFDCPPLNGLERHPDFQRLATDLLAKIRATPGDQRGYYKKLFVAAVSRTSPLLEDLLLSWLPEIETAEDLDDLADLTAFDGSLIVFRYPDLTEAILRAARAFSSSTYDQVTMTLLRGAGPRMRAYTSGQLDESYRYLRSSAEEAVAIHERNPILAPFYRRILEVEIRDADWHRQELEDRLESEW